MINPINEEINLSNLNLSNIDSILSFNNIIIFANRNKLNDIDINKCINLQILDISNNHIKTINHLPKSIKELYCSDNKIDFIVESDGLEILNCSGNYLSFISPYISLKGLECNDNYIFKIDALLYPNLKSLICKNNRIKKIVGFSNLEYIDISCNQLVEINNIPNIIDLLCNNNKITNLPPPSDIPNILYIEIQENDIKTIEYYPTLKDLYCDYHPDMKLSNKYNIKSLKNYNSSLVLFEFFTLNDK